MSRMSWPLLCAVSVASVAVACASIQPRMAPPPLLPFQTTFHHWDHHWFQWTPTHPLYESIEGASTKSPSGQDLVWVWLTERVGTKRQVHYLNDLQAATRPSGEAYYRDIRYRAIGTFGSPLGLEVRFKDKDDADVEWTIRMDEDGAFDAQGAGLTDQSGHGAAQFFLIFFREKSRRASSSRLTIGGADFSFPNDPTLAPRYRFQAAYSFNIFVASIPYGEGRVDVTNHGIVLRPFGGGVELLRQRDAPVYRSQSADGRQGMVVTFDRDGQPLRCEQVDSGHTFRVTFDEPLPMRDGGRVAYRMALDGFQRLIEGVATVTRNSDAVSVEWNHTRPSWALGYRFTSRLRSISPSGYDLIVASDGR
jgi:hypothetical protein